MTKNNFFRILRNNQGSLLLEVLAALGIGLITVTAISQLGVRALRDSGVSNKKALVTRFTQEGIEAVRSIRDQEIKNAFSDLTCGISANVTDPKAPPNDPAGGSQYICNEWSDVYRNSVVYLVGKQFSLIPPDTNHSYWQMVASTTPEDINGGSIKRKITISELTPTEPNNIKKITVESWTLDGGNTIRSIQETYLRKI